MDKVIYKQSNKIPLALLVLGGIVHAYAYSSCTSGLCSLTNSVWRLCGYRRGANISEAFTPVVPGNIGHDPDRSNIQPGITPHAYQIPASDISGNSLPGSSGDRPTAETNATLTVGNELTDEPVEMIAVKLYTLGGNYVDTVKIPGGTNITDAERIIFNALNADVLSKLGELFSDRHNLEETLEKKIQELLGQDLLLQHTANSLPKLCIEVEGGGYHFHSQSSSVEEDVIEGKVTVITSKLDQVILYDKLAIPEGSVYLLLDKPTGYDQTLFIKKVAQEFEIIDEEGRVNDGILASIGDEDIRAPFHNMYFNLSITDTTPDKVLINASYNPNKMVLKHEHMGILQKLGYTKEEYIEVASMDENGILNGTIVFTDTKGNELIRCDQGNVFFAQARFSETFRIKSTSRTADRIRKILQEQVTAGEPVAPEPNPPVAPEPNLL